MVIYCLFPKENDCMTAPITLKVDKINYPKKTKKEIFLIILQWVTLIMPLKLLFRFLFGRLGGKIVIGSRNASFIGFSEHLKELADTKSGDDVSNNLQQFAESMLKEINDFSTDKRFSKYQRRQLSVMVRYLTKLQNGESLSKRARRKIIRSQKLFNKLALLHQEHGIANKIANSTNMQQIRLITPDKTTLDAVKITSQAAFNSGVHVIKMYGRGGWYQSHIDKMQRAADHLGATYYGLNYRGFGTGEKGPRSKRDIVNDAITLVQHLIKQGVKPECIVLSGYSLGAATLTYAARHFHRLDQKVYLYNHRSFSSLTRVVLGFLHRIHQWIKYSGEKSNQINGHETSIIGKILAVILAPIVKFLIVFSGWEMNSARAFKGIPKKYREYDLAKAPKVERHTEDKKRILQRDDVIIPHYASLHRSLKSERKNVSKSTVVELSAHYELIKARKMRSGLSDGHTLSDDELTSRRFHGEQFQVSARQHFFSFVRAHQTVDSVNATVGEIALANMRNSVFGS